MRRYKILIVSHATEIGGAEKVLFGFIDQVDRERFDISLACPTGSPLIAEMSARGVGLHTGIPRPRLLGIRREHLGEDRLSVLLYPWDMARTVVELARLIRREAYDLVYTNSAKAHIYGSMAGRLARRPVVWRMHDIIGTDAYSRLNVWLFKACASWMANRVLPVSDASRAALAKWGVPAGKLFTIHNGLDTRAMQSRRGRAEMRRELGLPPDAPVAGMVGRLVPWKGPQVFVEAARRVLEEAPETYFLLVGDAVFGEQDFVDGLKSRVGQLGLEERVIFTGLRQDIPDLLGCMDVFVHASVLPEPFGMVILEAMFCTVPVVAARGGGVDEIVLPGETGLLVPPDDPQALARAVIGLLNDSEAARHMAEQGYRRAVADFDAGAAARAIEDEWLRELEDAAAC